MSKDIQQITEKQAADMLYSALVENHRDKIRRWKQAGYIKKSKLEEAREYFNKFELEKFDGVLTSNFKILQKLYEQAIEEINQSLDK